MITSPIWQVYLSRGILDLYTRLTKVAKPGKWAKGQGANQPLWQKHTFIQITHNIRSVIHSWLENIITYRLSHHAIVVISPNHIWATSWLCTVATRFCAATPLLLGSKQKAVVLPVISPWLIISSNMPQFVSSLHEPSFPLHLTNYI